jgi:hypothetical protein
VASGVFCAGLVQFFIILCSTFFVILCQLCESKQQRMREHAVLMSATIDINCRCEQLFSLTKNAKTRTNEVFCSRTFVVTREKRRDRNENRNGKRAETGEVSSISVSLTVVKGNMRTCLQYYVSNKLTN